jgi:hypothetical protein
MSGVNSTPVLLPWIDNFAMRNFTNDAVFDDTLPVADGVLEAGFRVPLEQLQPAMEDWFRRKGYLKPGEVLQISENLSLGGLVRRTRSALIAPVSCISDVDNCCVLSLIKAAATRKTRYGQDLVGAVPAKSKLRIP